MDPQQASQTVIPPTRSEFKGKDITIKMGKSMTKKMKEAASSNDWRSETCSIFKVPVGLRLINFETYDPKEIRNGPYDPKYVSIGPYHHGIEGLQPMEEFKWRAFDILTSEPNTSSIEECIKKMEKLEKRARSCYSEEIKMCHEDFVQMMLVDVCFVLMVLTDRLKELETKKGNNNYGQGGVRNTEVLSKNVLTDLLMLENQIPFFILREFFQLLSLDLYYWDSIEEAALDSLRSAYPGYNVTELEGFGVKFKTKEAKSFMNLAFRDGVMEIPSLILYPYTKTIFHNIIAFEQCFTTEVQPQAMAHISHYVMLMDFLIGNTSDIVTLQENEIITNWLGSQDEVVRVFNHLRRGVIDFSHDYFSDIYSEVNMYRRRKCPKWWAKFKLDYCNSPWSCIETRGSIESAAEGGRGVSSEGLPEGHRR
ncbi:UPF0481 protein [Acorus gramineus]|uniref:UPF0481 protein n=1 Tax=Acorus gramineus TaxID=55184 RepID=A0AAV9BW33_ACOGR|nr:UPF0481 protein [Acorus gramineus]